MELYGQAHAGARIGSGLQRKDRVLPGKGHGQIVRSTVNLMGLGVKPPAKVLKQKPIEPRRLPLKHMRDESVQPLF
jgi:hypothetical protein